MAKKTIKENEVKDVEVGSAFDLLPKSWEIVKKNWQAFAVVNIFNILSALLAIFPEYQDADSKFGSGVPWGNMSGFELGTLLGLGLLAGILIIAINIILYVMMTVLEVRSTENKQPTIGELFRAANQNWLWLKLIVLIIVCGVIGIASFIALIIPFIFILPRIIMAPYLMVDRQLSITDSLKQSFRLGKEFFGAIWAAIGVSVLIAIGTFIISAVPAIGPIFGTLFALAFSLVLVLRYQQLKNLKAVTVNK